MKAVASRPVVLTAISMAAALLGTSSCSYGEIRPSIARQEASADHVERFGPVSFQQIAPGVYQHTTYLDLPGFGPIPSNGLIVVDGTGSLLVDTAWTNNQTEAIILWANVQLGKPIRAAVVTHAHSDKMGGMDALHGANIATYAHTMSNQVAPEKDLTPARNTIAFGDDGWATGTAAQALAPLAIYYPGGGHTQDNITVGIPSAAIAFGGCLIKGSDSSSLGNLADANIEYYAQAAQNFADAFPDAKVIAMSHSSFESRKAITNTIKLAKQLD